MSAAKKHLSSVICDLIVILSYFNAYRECIFNKFACWFYNNMQRSMLKGLHQKIIYQQRYQTQTNCIVYRKKHKHLMAFGYSHAVLIIITILHVWLQGYNANLCSFGLLYPMIINPRYHQKCKLYCILIFRHFFCFAV